MVSQTTGCAGRQVRADGVRLDLLARTADDTGLPDRSADGTPTRPCSGWCGVHGAGCSRAAHAKHDLAATIRAGGFGGAELERYRIHGPFLPFNNHVAGIAPGLTPPP